LLKPGVGCRDVYREHNRYLKDNGLSEERRLSIHGMGYDMVERPLVRDDEDMTLEEHMAIVCHPGILNERMFVHNTDVYLIGENGPTECLHATPKRLFEIG
jgi:Xaa-Pro aminopeptidase